MKTIHHIQKWIVGLMFFAFALACSDDFLDKTKQYEINSETYFNSKEDYQNALIASYNLLHSTYINV